MQPISQYFGELTFGLGQMRERLSQKAYKALIKVLEQGKKLEKSTADEIALVIKDWAVSKGVTHFTHWFQPMRGITAEKHDAFISIQHSYHSELKVIERFSGSQLIQGEPDASSFPSGGMRSTFEARGYTAWVLDAPIFILEHGSSKTLCIPSVFMAYNGMAMDNKTHLLRSNALVSQNAVELLKLLGDVDAKSVQVTMGAEQEYFLIDQEMASRRPDLVMTGRTLLGAPAAKDQRLNDHYFGNIPTRVKQFMDDLEMQLYRLGVPIKTRHNEVAPGQFEMAPIFETSTIASYHNTLVMQLMKITAAKYGFLCLLHEKPFAGLNGSGKHCNWSVANDKGENLLEPGKTPHQNLRFLAMVSVVTHAVYKHGAMLRTAIASASNDHRLGGHEAPPPIISVYLGTLLDQIFESVLRDEVLTGTKSIDINLGVNQIPAIAKDYTDRNRTSPFAFTGNKFEFRAVGASANISLPVAVLNAAIANSLKYAATLLKPLLEQSESRDAAIMALIKKLMGEANKVLFSGNNYSDEWKEEARRRGLAVLPTTIEALETFKNGGADFLLTTGVFQKEELESNYQVMVENYRSTLEIEYQTFAEMVREYVIPAAELQLQRTSGLKTQITSKRLGIELGKRLHVLEEGFADILESQIAFEDLLKKAGEITGDENVMAFLGRDVKAAYGRCRAACDFIETQVDHDLWRLPKYREMLYHHNFSH
jgi:glutamine synthetase